MYSIEELANEQFEFLSNYNIQNILVSNDGSRNKLIPRNKRTCRFCKKSYPNVLFTNVAHLIPKSFGNYSLKSDFECDTCNNKFGLLETDFTSFLGIYKTLSPVNNERRKFTSNSIISKEITLTSGKTVTWIINSNLNQKVFSLDTEKGTGEINYLKPTYTPINVYKLLFKIAISCLRPEDTIDYDPLLQILQTNNNDKALSPFAARVSSYILSFKIQSPRIVLFNKIHPSCQDLMHHIQIYFQEFVFVIPIPLNRKDFNLFKKTSLELKICPPLFIDKPNEPVNYNREFIDLSSLEKVKENDAIHFGSDPSNFQNLSSFDAIEGIKGNIDLKDVQIEGMIQAKEGEVFDQQDILELQNIFKEIRKINSSSKS